MVQCNICKITFTYSDILALEIFEHFGGEIFDDGELNNRFESEAAVQLVGAVASKPVPKPSMTVPILRKDFPETWIWDEVNEEG